MLMTKNFYYGDITGDGVSVGILVQERFDGFSCWGG